MLDESAVLTLMRAQLKTVAILPDPESRIAWMNHQFEPPSLPGGPGSNVLWLREGMRILSERHSTMGHIETIGETYYMIETPRGRGTRDADALAKAIAEVYEPTQSLTGGGTTIVLERTERRPYSMDPEHSAWVYKMVSIQWRAFSALTQ